MENNTNDIQSTPIENQVVETTAPVTPIKSQAVETTTPEITPVNVAPQVPVYNNNFVNMGVILGTAAVTLAAGTGVYFGLIKLTEIIKNHLHKDESVEEN